MKCRFSKDSITGFVEGLEGYEEFSDFLNRCGDGYIKILIYENCYIGYLSLPIEKIQLNYPSLKRIYWLCKGNCVYVKSSVFVEGVVHMIIFKNFIHYINVFLNTIFFSQ